MQELERDTTSMAAHIRTLEKILADNGHQVKPWEGAAKYPPDKDKGTSPSPPSKGKPEDHSTASSPGFTPSFPRSRLESRPEESHLGVGRDNAPLSSINGMRLSILGTTIDTASFDNPDIDEPPPDARAPTPLYNKSVQAFHQSTMGVNPPLQPDLPSRQDAFTYSDWYFMTISAFLPLLHKPTFMTLVLLLLTAWP